MNVTSIQDKTLMELITVRGHASIVAIKNWPISAHTVIQVILFPWKQPHGTCSHNLSLQPGLKFHFDYMDFSWIFQPVCPNWKSLPSFWNVSHKKQSSSGLKSPRWSFSIQVRWALSTTGLVLWFCPRLLEFLTMAFFHDVFTGKKLCCDRQQNLDQIIALDHWIESEK